MSNLYKLTPEQRCVIIRALEDRLRHLDRLILLTELRDNWRDTHARLYEETERLLRLFTHCGKNC